MKINIFYLDDELDLCEIFSDCFSTDKINMLIAINQIDEVFAYVMHELFL